MSALFYSLAAVLALAYGAWFCLQDHGALRSAIKTGAVVFLAFAAAASGAPGLLIAALALSAAGDFFLSRPGEKAFLAGLVSFACAHIAYIALFASLATGWPPLLAALALLAFGVSTEHWLAPHTGNMRWPVRFYVGVICGMGLAALSLPSHLGMALIGALAFMASDTLLAVQLFRMPPDTRWNRVVSPLLWALYWGAQLLITVAVVG